MVHHREIFARIEEETRIAFTDVPAV